MRKIKVILLSVLCSATFLACEKNENLGPGIDGLYGELEVITPLSHDKQNGVDFSTGEMVNINAEINLNAIWNIQIVGRESGALAELSGQGERIAGQWSGKADNGFFKQEWADIILSIDNQEDKLIDSIEVKAGIDLNSLGILLADFELETGNFNVVGASGPKGFTDTSAVLFTPVYDSDPETAIQGNGYFKFTGSELGGAYWMGALRWDNTINITDADPENVYFNFYIYGYNRQNTRCILKTTETDGDIWKYQVDIDAPEWQLVSIKYSDMVTDGGNGNKAFNPEAVEVIDFVLGSNGAIGSYGYAIDVPIITYGSPL